jgi:FKBP-type peptidyl-prolyl cis-trans isomerase FkpA
MMRIISIRLLILPVFLSLMVSGCLKNEWDQQEQHEKEVIQTYLTANNITEEQKTEGGIYYVEKVAGTGLSPLGNNYVVINYTGRYLEDGSIHETTYDSLKADWANSSLYTFFVYGPLRFQYGYSIAGINEGLSMMKEGGKASLIIPSDKAFYDFKPMEYEVELLKVIRDPVAYEDSVFHMYLAEKNYDSTMWYISGNDTIYFKETVTPDPGDERTVQPGDTVYFRYTGKLVDGFSPVIKDDRVFDSDMDDAKPIKYIFGSSVILSGEMLAFPNGLKLALDTMRSGTHATALLHYKQAFGDKGLSSTIYGYTIVPKYQTVVYDVVVESIRQPSK